MKRLLLRRGEEVEDHLGLVAGVALVVGVDALAVLEEEGAATGHADHVLHAEGFGDGLLLLVGEKAEGELLLFLEFFLQFLVVGADAEDVHAGLLEVGPAVAERAALLGAAAGLGLRVEVDEQVALGAFLGEGDGIAVLVVAGDVRDGGADGELFSRVTEEGEEGHEEGGEEGLHDPDDVGRPPKGKCGRRCFRVACPSVRRQKCPYVAGRPRHHPSSPAVPLPGPHRRGPGRRRHVHPDLPGRRAFLRRPLPGQPHHAGRPALRIGLPGGRGLPDEEAPVRRRRPRRQDPGALPHRGGQVQGHGEARRYGLDRSEARRDAPAVSLHDRHGASRRQK